ncbi:hypothetical protein ABIE87_002132 [Bradyrhizobium diazoefficiens]
MNATDSALRCSRCSSEIEQHQSARKQQAEHLVPAVRRREQFLLVEHHELVRFGSEQHDIGLAEDMGAVDRAVFGAVRLDMPLGVGQHLEGLADDRPALVARDVRQLVTPGGGELKRRGGHILHRHDECSGWLTERTSRDRDFIAACAS